MGLTVAIAVVALTCIAGSTDWWKRKIPNWLTVGAFALGLAFHSATQGWVGVRFTLAGFALGFGILFVLWMTGGAGAGDVKLMGALGAWLGTSLILVVFVLSGLLALIDWLPRRILQSRNNAPTQRPRRIPYAVPVAVATCAVVALKLVNLYHA